VFEFLCRISSIDDAFPRRDEEGRALRNSVTIGFHGCDEEPMGRVGLASAIALEDGWRVPPTRVKCDASCGDHSARPDGQECVAAAVQGAQRPLSVPFSFDSESSSTKSRTCAVTIASSSGSSEQTRKGRAMTRTTPRGEGCENILTLPGRTRERPRPRRSRRTMQPSWNVEGDPTGRPPSGGASDSARCGRRRW
jgi:hypothetical protein